MAGGGCPVTRARLAVRSATWRGTGSASSAAHFLNHRLDRADRPTHLTDRPNPMATAKPATTLTGPIVRRGRPSRDDATMHITIRPTATPMLAATAINNSSARRASVALSCCDRHTTR